jgi:hypothetical protein
MRRHLPAEVEVLIAAGGHAKFAIIFALKLIVRMLVKAESLAMVVTKSVQVN